MSPNTKADGPAGDFVFGDAIIPSGVAGGRAIRAASIRTLVDYSNSHSSMAEHGLYKIMDIVSLRSFVICSSQREHFGVDDIRLCC